MRLTIHATVALAALGLLALTCGTGTAYNVDKTTIDGLESWLLTHRQTPERYVVGKFADHQIVFLGERHRLKHDVRLVQHLVPHLYEAGVFAIGTEFADFADQPRIDSLVTGDSYSDSVAGAILFDHWPYWGYQDYADIFKAAWAFNQTLPDSARPFRIIGLNARADWSHVWTEGDRQNPETMKKVWANGDSDESMAKVILEEIVAKGDKALIHCGHNHAYTRYRQPHYDPEQDSLYYLNDKRAGNRVSITRSATPRVTSFCTPPGRRPPTSIVRYFRSTV